MAMPSKMSHKRKQTLVRLAEEMRNKKRAKLSAQETTTATASNLDDSLELPGPSAVPVPGESDDRESDGEDYRGSLHVKMPEHVMMIGLLLLKKSMCK